MLCMGSWADIHHWVAEGCTAYGLPHEPHDVASPPYCPDCGNLLTDTGPRCRDCAGPMPPRGLP